MWVVAGLGNPGHQYSGTRHNVGFEVVDVFAVRHGVTDFRYVERGEVATCRVKDVEALLVKPMTYMNLSGDCIQAVLTSHGVGVERLVVVHDELDFDPGQVRLKRGGGDGGHNGLRSIVSCLGRDFARVRVGVGKPAPGVEGISHVLSIFDESARSRVDDAVQCAADALEWMLLRGLPAAMNRYNRKSGALGTGLQDVEVPTK